MINNTSRGAMEQILISPICLEVIFMSLKPPKKSDLDKNWMKARQDRPKKIQPEYHLIVTEGTETEPAYFGAIRDIINSSYPDKIQLNIHGIGNNTLTLFQKAKQLSDASANGYRHVWIVYDTDDFPAEHINKTAQLCVSESTDDTTYHAIWSNQCIELWFLLHFSFLQADLHRSSYWPKLTEILSFQGLGSYEKIEWTCIKFYIHTWILPLQMLKNLKNQYRKISFGCRPRNSSSYPVKKLKSYL